MTAAIQYIEVDRPQGPYYPGDTVTGTVHIAISSDIRARRLCIYVIGFERVLFDSMTSSLSSQKAEFFKQKHTAWKSTAMIGQVLPMGVQQFPFTLQLSNESATQVLLEAYEDEMASIQYQLVATLEDSKLVGSNAIASASIPLKFQPGSYAPGHVSLAPVDKRCMLQIQPAPDSVNQIPVNIGFRISLPSGRVYAGKSFNVAVSCLDNVQCLSKYTREQWQSNGHVVAELRQCRQYTTPAESIVASDIKSWHDINARTLDFQLDLPYYLPTSTDGGKLIRVSYQLIVRLAIGDGTTVACSIVMIADSPKNFTCKN
ncbi:hypothetical protein BDF19DRAFT_429963 [Syncephalis fuscata]|nr:hypothetical protein BDF19DRAFT_429963 [Syncephalis fuscata]